MEAKEQNRSVVNLKTAVSISSLLAAIASSIAFALGASLALLTITIALGIALGFIIAYFLGRAPLQIASATERWVFRFRFVDLLLAWGFAGAGVLAILIHGWNWSLVFATLFFVACGIYWLYRRYEQGKE